jgi:hypothetical protein
MPRIRFTALVALALLGACAAQPTPRGGGAGADLVLPAQLRQANTDPGRTAIGFTDATFGRPAAVQGRPAVAADAVAQLEWLTVNLATDQRWSGMPGNVAGQFPGARDEVRQALGIRADATTNTVIGAMDGTAAALRGGDRAAALRALGPAVAPDGAERALSVLNALPRLPRASQATSAASAGLSRMDRDTRR